MADLTIYDALDVSNLQLPGILEEYPTLKNFHARVEARPKIAKWLLAHGRQSDPNSLRFLHWNKLITMFSLDLVIHFFRLLLR